MPFAVTHILAPILILEIFRNLFFKDHKKFPRYYILIAALGGILPDFDIGIFYVLYFFGFSIDQVHRTILHTIFVPLILFFVGIIFYFTGTKIKEFGLRHLKISTTFFILALGALIHLVLDSIFSGYIMPLYPILDFRIGLNLVSIFPSEMNGLILGTLDGILLILWLIWMEFKLKITRYF